MSVETHPLTYIDPICRQPAFHRVGVPVIADPLRSVDHEHIDGRAVETHDRFACDSCGRSFSISIDMPSMTDPANYRPRVAA